MATEDEKAKAKAAEEAAKQKAEDDRIKAEALKFQAELAESNAAVELPAIDEIPEGKKPVYIVDNHYVTPNGEYCDSTGELVDTAQEAEVVSKADKRKRGR